MIERLSRALDHLDDLPEEAQEAIARQIEAYHAESARPESGIRRFAGIWSDLPDEMDDTLMRWRHESVFVSGF